MKKTAWLLIVGLFVSLGILGCGGGGGRPSLPPTLSGEQIANVLDSTSEKYNQIAEAQGEEIARQGTVEWLKKQPEVKQAEIGPDETTICFTYTDGTPASLITKPLESETEGSTEELLGRLSSTRAAMPGNKKAILMDAGLPLAETFARTLPRTKNMLETCGYDCRYLKGEDVNLDSLSRLSEYGVILFAGHGTYRINGEQWIIGWATGQRVTKQDLEREDIRQARARGDIGVTQYSFWEDPLSPLYPRFFKVFPSFFLRNGGKYPDSFIASYTCLGLYNDTMADAFLNLGAAVYCGWTRLVRPAFDQGKIITLFDNLTNSKTIGEAVTATGDPTFQFRPSIVSDFRITEVPMKILTTPPGYDDIGQVLNSLGYQTEEISLVELADSIALNNCRVLAINCATGLTDISESVIQNIRNFVSNGGRLYASDWAFTIIDRAFPDKIIFPEDSYIGISGQVNASVINDDLKNFLGYSTISIEYDLSGWVPIFGIASEVNVLLYGSYEISGEEYSSSSSKAVVRQRRSVKALSSGLSRTGQLAVSFNYGNGKVVYTTFHEKVQTGGLQKALMEYLALY